jgi:hypothetical protein
MLYFLLETAAFSLEPAVSLTLWPAAIWMVAAGACCTVGALHSEPARDGDLLAGGNRGLENLEQSVEDGVDGSLAGAGLASYLCNKFTTVLSHLCPPGRFLILKPARGMRASHCSKTYQLGPFRSANSACFRDFLRLITAF